MAKCRECMAEITYDETAEGYFDVYGARHVPMTYNEMDVDMQRETIRALVDRNTTEV